MAKIVPNEKGFKVIELSMTELVSIGGLSICDSSNRAMAKGYYIAVLNHTYCEEEYFKWLKRAVRYDEDISYELTSFNRMAKTFNLKVQ